MSMQYAIGPCIAMLGFFASTAQVSVNHEGYLTNPDADSSSIAINDPDYYIIQARRRAEFSTGRFNIFIFSRQKRFNLASFLMKSSTGISSVFNSKIRIIKVNSPEQLAEKMQDLMESNQDKMIGNLWFDSHGVYKTGHSLMTIGKDTIHYKSIRSPRIRNNLAVLSAYCDEKSVITIGACYSAATFKRPGNDKLTESRMNGDSLMKGMANIFRISPILGSVSWIMTKPFLLGNKWGLAGYPMELKFRDEIYKPAWERIGMWRIYDPATNEFSSVNTVYLDRNGDIKVNKTNYLDLPKVQRKMKNNLKMLRHGMYELDAK